ncbi:hypothetical protein E2P64_00285 [Candidatus Bathyarchaeota archaeon]|nr:hypothetical protein E2P64_00285 [Candidatus Bathyarchaeota archaeon]
MKWFFPVFLLLAAHAAEGDRICEASEIGINKDCAMINQNYICDSFTNDLPQYDPDCNTTVGQTCFDSLFAYSGGRGSSCYPGNCTEGTGCTTSCTSDSHCNSGFCVGNTCEPVCDGCKQTATNYDVYPFSTTIYMGDPTFVSFRVNRSSGDSAPGLTADGPCTLDYDSSIDLGSGYSIAVVKVSDCVFTGLGSIRLTVTGTTTAWGVVHFLSYPAMSYSLGDTPRGVVGYSSMSGNMGGVPIEVKTWVG